MGVVALAWRVRGGGLLISTLVYESQAYVDDAVENLLAFTLPSTQIVVHLSAGSKATAAAAAWASRARVHVNARPETTCSACGMVTRQHAANVRYAARRNVTFDHVALFASTCRLFAGGGFFERHVATFNFSAAAEPNWAQAALRGAA